MRPSRQWPLYVAFILLSLIAPAMLVYDLVYQLDLSGGRLDGPAVLRLATAAGVAAVFWSFTGFLLIRRFRQGIVRLLFVHGQVLSATMIYPLAHPSPWTDPPGILGLSIAGFYFLAPLTLHLQISFPVALGTERQRRWVLGSLYLAALAWVLVWLSGAARFSRIGELYTIGVFAASIVVLIYAYVFRATPDSRRRLRIIWFGSLLAIVPGNVLYFVPGLYGWPPRIPVWLVGVLLIIFPASCLYAITRQNLFGIDRLINRTLVYTLLAAGIFAVYLIPLVYIYNVLSIGWLGQAVVSAGITLVIGWNFTLLSTRVERLVDRLFYGGWYDYPSVVDSISDALTRSLEIDQVIEVLTRRVPELMRLHTGRFSIGRAHYGAELDPRLPDLTFSFTLQDQQKSRWHVAGHLDGEDFSTIDRQILKTLARQAEIALNNVVLVEALRRQLDEIRRSRETLGMIQRQLLRSREEERSRLARDLHDGPLQSLIGMNIQLGMLQSSLPSPGGGALQELRTEVRNLLDDLRAVCTELRPPMLDTLGLGAALRALAVEWSQQHGIAVYLDLPAEGEVHTLTGETAVNLYRVAQEALSNIARHAKAQTAVVSLRRDDNCHELSIRDDGCGFEVPVYLHNLAEYNHFGLAGMHERVELIGGTLAISSQPGEGTHIQVRV